MREPTTKDKRKILFETYKKLLNYTCAHPECNSGLDIEAHHIRPLKKGGADAYWNIIALCKQCHHTKKLHSQSEKVICELSVYKCMHESKNVGFYFDELENGFRERFNKAVKNNKYMDDTEKYVAINTNMFKLKGV